MSLRKRIGLFLVRLAAMLIAAGVLLCLPDAGSTELITYKNAIVSFLLVISLGKLLLDTFFFDR